MKWKYYLSRWHILAFFYFALILLSFIVPANASTTIGFHEQYVDSVGMVHDLSNENLAEYPMYTRVETPDNYWVTRGNDTIYLPKKSWIEYQFYPERIVPIYRIDNYSQINSLVTKVDSSRWYLTVPFSAYRYKSITDDLIDFGAFRRTTKVTTIDSNDTPNSYRVVPRVIDNQIQLWFNPQEFKNVVYPLYLTENTITIDNSTFWSNQDCGDGYWSAYGGGSCGTPLNSSIHANLSGYWDMESTSGTTEHGINKYGRFPNSTIAGTWNGNTTINYTSSQNWGNAASFNGASYISIPHGSSINLSTGISLKNIVNVTQYVAFSQITSKTPTAYEMALGGTPRPYIMVRGNNLYLYSSSALSSSTWYNLLGTYNSALSSIHFYINDGINEGASVLTDLGQPILNNNLELKMGNVFNGSIDEVIIDSSGNPIYSNSTYSIAWNKTFLNNSAPAQHVVTAVKFNIYNLNVQGNSANISVRQNGTGAWTQIATNYSGDNTTWINGTWWQNTDFAVNVSGNGSSRSFIIDMTYDEAHIPVDITGYVNNSLGAYVDGALVTINGASTLSRHTYQVDNTDLCTYNHTSNHCDGSRESGVTYNASSNIQLIVMAHANNVSQTADITVNIDGVNVTRSSGRPLGAPPEQSYKQTVILIPAYANYTVYFSNYHHYEWREYPLVHGYYNLTSEAGIQNVLVRQVGYANFTDTLNASVDMSYNITLSEKETVSEDLVIDYSLVGAIIGGLLAFVLLRRKRKDDDYIYKGE